METSKEKKKEWVSMKGFIIGLIIAVAVTEIIKFLFLY